MSDQTPIRYRAVVEYDGTDFYGFQRQRKDFRTVQGELERALAVLVDRPVGILAAGRTDTGVHATGQVIAFDLAWPHGEDTLLRALNANLARDVAVQAIAPTRTDFHPRFDARRRAYRYLIELCPSGRRRPLSRLYRWQVSEALDLPRMNEASRALIGVHDFATFGTAPQGENTTRELFRAEWHQVGDEVIFDIEANAFLYRMVRSLVASLKRVGDGSWSLERFMTAFTAADRPAAAAPAPPNGLFLVSVTYDLG